MATHPPLSLYGNYVENFGISNAFSLTASGTAPPPEPAQQWEIGGKTEFFDGRLSATGLDPRQLLGACGGRRAHL